MGVAVRHRNDMFVGEWGRRCWGRVNATPTEVGLNLAQELHIVVQVVWDVLEKDQI